MGLRRALRRARIALSPGGRAHLRLHDSIQGQLAVEESRFLLHAARGRRTIVEIGSYRGKSAAMLALGSAPAGHVTAIDPHIRAEGAGTTAYCADDEHAFRQTMDRLGLAARVTHIVKASADARPDWPDTPIDLLWIDGDHSYEAVRRDLEDWAPLVRPGGILAAHDYTHREGVRRAWGEIVGGDAGWGPTRHVRSIAWTTRSPDGPPA